MILLTGASGLLGTHLELEAERPTHQELDITKPIKPKDYKLIVHAAAYTQVEQAEIDRMECFDVNVRGTMNLINAYPTTPFVFISSEYAHNPVNFYSWTKYWAEEVVKSHPKYLIIRTLFKPTPWKYPKAFKDAWTQGDYVTKIAPLIEEEIVKWIWSEKSKTVYVGTGRKTIYDLARQTRDVKPISVDDIKDVKLPKDYL